MRIRCIEFDDLTLDAASRLRALNCNAFHHPPAGDWGIILAGTLLAIPPRPMTA
jgi:hypothetical protein